MKWTTSVLIAMVASPAFGNLLFNGSFETPLVPDGGTATYPGGSTAITGWTVVGVDSDLINKNFTQNGITFQSQQGDQWIDLAGHTSNSMTSGVTQDISTTPGALYEISFYVGSATDNVFFFPSIIDLSINGGPRQSYTNPTAPSDSLDWKLFTVPFVATGSSTNITFYNGGAPNNFLSALDNASVDQIASSVPEPSVLILGVAGVPALGARKNRQKRRALS